MSVVVHMWEEITDVIDNAEKLLNLLFGKLLIWKVKQFLGNVLSWLVMAIFNDHTEKFNVVSCNGAFFGRQHDSMTLDNIIELS